MFTGFASQIRGRGQRGQGMVEFALAIPLIMLVVVGLFDVGRMVYINNAVSEGAREAARYGVVQGRSRSDAGVDSIKSEARARMAAVPNPVVTVQCVDHLTLSAKAPTDCRGGDLLNITVTSNVSAITPLISDIIGPLALSSTVRMTIHN